MIAPVLFAVTELSLYRLLCEFARLQQSLLPFEYLLDVASLKILKSLMCSLILAILLPELPSYNFATSISVFNAVKQRYRASCSSLRLEMEE